MLANADSHSTDRRLYGNRLPDRATLKYQANLQKVASVL
jgi:hypothetical protein